MAWGRCAVPGNSWRYYCAKKESMGRYSCKKRESERNQGSVRWVSGCNFRVSRFKPRSRSGFQVAISKFQVSNQDPGQGFSGMLAKHRGARHTGSSSCHGRSDECRMRPSAAEGSGPWNLREGMVRAVVPFPA